MKNEKDIRNTQTIVNEEHIRFSIDLKDGVTKEEEVGDGSLFHFPA
ncbi:hypothetical protein [Neobacillus bataviensis]|nr:hypothetical protein [Neobacillus bataviensis]